MRQISERLYARAQAYQLPQEGTDSLERSVTEDLMKWFSAALQSSTTQHPDVEEGRRRCARRFYTYCVFSSSLILHQLMGTLR